MASALECNTGGWEKRFGRRGKVSKREACRIDKNISWLLKQDGVSRVHQERDTPEVREL